MLTKLRAYHNREDGFTLVELLIVVLIIGILATIAIPVYLGLQNQAKNNSTKQDVNSAVTSIQVALTEGQSLATALNNNSDSGNRADGTNVTASSALDGSNNYTVTGTQKDTQFTYTYDSKTGQFTEGSANLALGGGAPNPGGGGGASSAPTTTTPAFTSTPISASTAQFANYTYTVTTSGNPAPTYSISAGSLPTGLSINSGTGVISGSPTGTGTYNFTIKADNGVGTAPTQNGTITVGAATALYDSGSGAGFDQTWTSRGASISYGSNGMNLNSNSVAANASKDFSGLTVGGVYKITASLKLTSGTSYANQSGVGASDTTTTAPTGQNTPQNNATTSPTVTYNFTATATTMRVYAMMGNYYGNVTNGAVYNLTIIRVS